MSNSIESNIASQYVTHGVLLTQEDYDNIERIDEAQMERDFALADRFMNKKFVESEDGYVYGRAIGSNDEALAVLEKVGIDYRAGVNYELIRDEFLDASFTANSFCLTAPVFRPQPKMSGKKSEWVNQKKLLADLIVIDCHWLYVRDESVEAKWPEIKRMFDLSKSFSIKEIEDRVARKNWSSGFKSGELLTLTHRQQYQLVQLRDEPIKQRMRMLIDGSSKSVGLGTDGKEKKVRVRAPFLEIKRKIREWADARTSVRSSIQMYESLWLARELLGPGAPLKQYAELAALRCGCKPLSTKTIDEKLKALDRRLAQSP